MTKKESKLVYSTRSGGETGAPARPQGQSLPPQQQTIRLMLDKKRRRGKTVTVCSGFQLTPADLKELEKMLKQYCGAGGTSKGDEIEIQGDQRDKIMQRLAALNYKVKRAGG